MAEAPDNTRLLYEENAKVAHAFWEWRHKVMTRFFLTSASLVAVAGWFYATVGLRRWAFVPFLLLAVFALVSHFLDRVNTWVLRDCYRCGKELEQKLDGNGWIYSSIDDGHYNRGSYYRVLSIVYIGTAVLSLSLSILLGLTALLGRL